MLGAGQVVWVMASSAAQYAQEKATAESPESRAAKRWPSLCARSSKSLATPLCV